MYIRACVHACIYVTVCACMYTYVHVCTYIALHCITLHIITLLMYILELCSCYYTSSFFSVMKATNQTCTAFKSHSRRVAWSHLAEPWVCGLAHVRGNSLTKMWKATQMGKYRIQNGFLNIDLNLCMIESWKSQSLLIRETLSEFTRDYSRKQFIYSQMSKEARILSGFPRARRGALFAAFSSPMEAPKWAYYGCMICWYIWKMHPTPHAMQPGTGWVARLSVVRLQMFISIDLWQA